MKRPFECNDYRWLYEWIQLVKLDAAWAAWTWLISGYLWCLSDGICNRWVGEKSKLAKEGCSYTKGLSTNGKLTYNYAMAVCNDWLPIWNALILLVPIISLRLSAQTDHQICFEFVPIYVLKIILLSAYIFVDSNLGVSVVNHSSLISGWAEIW